MRLKPQEIEAITSVIKHHLAPVEVYLFGSRVNDIARGGDIDLLIIGEDDIEIINILRIKIDLKEKLGDQNIDVLYERRGKLTPFAQLAAMEGIPL